MSYRPDYFVQAHDPNKRQLTIAVSRQLYAEIDLRAKAAKLSRAEYVRLIVAHHVGIQSKASATHAPAQEPAPC